MKTRKTKRQFYNGCTYFKTDVEKIFDLLESEDLNEYERLQVKKVRRHVLRKVKVYSGYSLVYYCAYLTEYLEKLEGANSKLDEAKALLEMLKEKITKEELFLRMQKGIEGVRRLVSGYYDLLHAPTLGRRSINLTMRCEGQKHLDLLVENFKEKRIFEARKTCIKTFNSSLLNFLKITGDNVIEQFLDLLVKFVMMMFIENAGYLYLLVHYNARYRYEVTLDTYYFKYIINIFDSKKQEYKEYEIKTRFQLLTTFIFNKRFGWRETVLLDHILFYMKLIKPKKKAKRKA